MKWLSWRIVLALVLLLLSAGFYLIHYMIFHDAHHIFIYLIGDVAFVFIEVLLVTMIIHHVLNEWEKRSRMKKLNMVIETFFSEFGKPLLAYLSEADTNLPSVRDAVVMESPDASRFKKAQAAVRSYRSNIDLDRIELGRLERFLRQRRGFLVNLLQNPNLLEHETFTESLMAVFHVTEELASRDLAGLSADDSAHTKVDIERAYGLLIRQWVAYMRYTHDHYPYFYKFAVATNPFDADAGRYSHWSDNVHGEGIDHCPERH